MTGDMPRGYSIRARGLGAPGNGLPLPGGYAYDGTGQDRLTPRRVMAAWNRRVRDAAGGKGRARLVRAEQEIALRDPLPVPRPAAPAPRVTRPAPRGTVREEAAPARCGDCGYLRAAIGHKVACGDGAA